MVLIGGFCLGLAGLALSALGQTNLDADTVPTGNYHNLSPVAGILRLGLWFLAAALLVIASVLLALRNRLATNLYKASSDAQWKDDSQEDAGERVAADEVLEACEVVEKGPQPAEAAEAGAEIDHRPRARLFTPASGVAWREPMLKAFLGTCLKVNCLGRTWRESAARQAQSSNLPDPREAELMRRLMQRWQEFHVDPDTGVFLERSSAAGNGRVCVISVVKDKRTLAEAGFNAGFVIESVGRYLKNTDLVYRRGLGEYHAPTKDELAAMTPGERESMVRITEIPDPWRAMIAGRRAASPRRMNYSVRTTGVAPQLDADWSDSVWEQADTLEIQYFRPESSDHHPQTSVRLLHDRHGIYGSFRVQDRYVRCVRTQYHDPVWKDSCVEFFAQPKPERGYFNFEFNCGGAFLCCYITKPERTPEGFKEFIKVPAGIGQTIRVRHSLPPRIEPEITEAIVWRLSFFIPFALFEHYLGPLGEVMGQVWRGNFFKCAEDNSHPHWAAWSPVDTFNFHRADCFGTIRFD